MWYNARRMKKGFTLVELLVVVVVLVTLMTMTFRLSSIGSSQSARTTTVARLQKLENCLSGYYAAFGSYPPVRLHGSRNYRLKVSGHGIQSVDDEQDLKWSWFDRSSHSVNNSQDEADDWEQVQAACRAQPLACKFPFPQDANWRQWAQATSDLLVQESNASGLSENQKNKYGGGFSVEVTGLSAYNNESDWREVQIFQFGLMSFLLPRYLVMMDSESSLFRDHEQWLDNNTLPCDPLSGRRFANWQSVQNYANSETPSDLAHVANIPSQSVCARWLPNLEGICRYGHPTTFYGVDIRDPESQDAGGPIVSTETEIYSPGGYANDSTSGQYILDGVTVVDGWQNDFYYYSPAPYQSYVLWSAGPNGKTFPPWVSRESLDANAAAGAAYWTEDDVVNMSH